jgi:hypothetical protein
MYPAEQRSCSLGGDLSQPRVATVSQSTFRVQPTCTGRAAPCGRSVRSRVAVQIACSRLKALLKRSRSTHQCAAARLRTRHW